MLPYYFRGVSFDQLSAGVPILYEAMPVQHDDGIIPNFGDHLLKIFYRGDPMPALCFLSFFYHMGWSALATIVRRFRFGNPGKVKFLGELSP